MRASQTPTRQVLLASLLFGTTGTAQALGPSASPLAVGAARIAVGGLLLALVARFVKRRRGGRRWHRGVLVAAALGVAGYQLSFFTAVSETGVAIGTVVALGSGPSFAGLLGAMVRGERLSGRWAACTALAVGGVALLVLGGETAAVSVPGVLAALGAGFSYATYTVASKSLLADGHSPEGVMAGAFGLGAVLLLPVLPLAGAGWLASADGLALALYLGAVPTAVAYLLFARGLRSLSAAETATLTLAEPLTAAALGVVVLSEQMQATGIAGAALVIAGLAAMALPGWRRPLPVPA